MSEKIVGDFDPTFPFYLVCENGYPIGCTHAGGMFAVAASSKELAELIANNFRKAGHKGRPGLMPVTDAADFQNIIRKLSDQGVTHMTWNATGASKTVLAIRLADFLDRCC